MKEAPNAIETTHKLYFEAAPYHIQLFKDRTYSRFRIGMIEGLYCVFQKEYQILAVHSNQIGSGHMEDVLQWFENSARRDGFKVRVQECWNKRLKEYLRRNGYHQDGKDDMVKKCRK